MEAETPTPYGRPEAIEDLSNRWLIHPLSERLVRLARALDLTPNQLSCLGLACGLAAALFYLHTPGAPFAIGGFLCMAAWHVFDGADGRLARLTGQTSAFGRVIDGLCDHLVFTAIYLALAWTLSARGWGLEAFGLALAAGLSHAVQAAGYEARRQRHQRRAQGLAPTAIEAGGGLERLYGFAQRLADVSPSPFDSVLADRRLTPDERANVLRLSARHVRLWSALNANNRTLAIFLFALAGRPEFYFLYELLVLNALYALGVLVEPRLEAWALRRNAPKAVLTQEAQ